MNISERSLSFNTPWLGLDKKSGNCKRLEENIRGRERGDLLKVVSHSFRISNEVSNRKTLTFLPLPETLI